MHTGVCQLQNSHVIIICSSKGDQTDTQTTAFTQLPLIHDPALHLAETHTAYNAAWVGALAVVGVGEGVGTARKCSAIAIVHRARAHHVERGVGRIAAVD
jgi:hypothetical protein